MEHPVGRVFVMSDEPRDRLVLCERLRAEGYVVLVGLRDEGVNSVIEIFQPDVIVTRLDPGYENLAPLVPPAGVPVVIIASAGTPSSARVAAIRSGGDSVFTDPVDGEEVVARVDVLLKQRQLRRLLTVWDVEIDRSGHAVHRNGLELSLTATEYNLLLELATNAGQVLSKRQLLERVWRFREYDENLVEVHVSALRRKLEAAGPRLIQTVRGFGYVLRPKGVAPHPQSGIRYGRRAGDSGARSADDGERQRPP
jgi:DNA-binding response OmpR family regulator